MSLLGLFGEDKKKKDMRAYYARPVPQSGDSDNPPWVQALQQANSTRSTFWNNIKGEGVGQSWNKSGGNRVQKLRERARMRRRRLI